MKKFLKIRDTAEEYRKTREEKHNAGIPCLIIDDKVFPVESPEMAEELVQEYGLGNEA